MVQGIIWKADCHLACQSMPPSYGILSFITAFRKAPHWTLSWVSRIQIAPSIAISVGFILIIFSHLILGLPKVSYILTSHPKSRKHFSPLSRVPHGPPTSFSLINYPKNIRWKTQVMKFIIMQFSPCSVFLPSRSKYLPQYSVFESP